MIKRIYVEKKKGYDVIALKAKNDFKNVLGIKAEDVRYFIRYDIENIQEDIYVLAKNTIFSEQPVDNIYEGTLPLMSNYENVVVEFLPGQYDQRADSAMQCVQLLSMQAKPMIRCATVYAISGVNKDGFNEIKKFLINPVESREGNLSLPNTLKQETAIVGDVPILSDFYNMNDAEVESYHKNIGFAMSVKDLKFVKEYFVKENRIPTETELKVIDTYWSDHCRHTTFNTEITNVVVNSNNPHISLALGCYNELFEKYNSKRDDKYKCLMDIATIAVKELKSHGLLDNLDTSDEINACSVVVDVDNDGKNEEWLIMFKNETHNHPTEIEPFGGAATCLGGAIRDPLSGRTYVYQAMRVTGCADPRAGYKETLAGKLPQRVISKTAAAGYSSYGNQIGLATGIVAEMYHEGYKAKRLETGYVIAGAPRENIVRKKPKAGDIVVLLGGETGRDGCGGATGSSKAHTEKSVEVCGAEVQKGNALTERKIQRLFRNKDASTLILKCNDFGAGGVSVAIGELADSLDIYLDNIPKKYEGLTGTELAISESQERMAVVLDKNDVDKFISYAKEENLIATTVAEITDSGRMRMFFKGKIIVDLAREFLDTNGVKQTQDVVIEDNVTDYFTQPNKSIADLLEKEDFEMAIKKELSRLNITSEKGLGEIFDSTIGAKTVLMPFGGKYQLTPSIVMAAKPPVSGKTDTVTVSSFACSPYLMSESSFTGAIYSIVTSVSKLIASGVKLETIRLTLQEYFKKLGNDKMRWGEPTSALLGALYAQLGLGVGAIGGKDSMSGTFENIDVPPTLISFAMGITKASTIISNTFIEDKDACYIYEIALPVDENNVPDFESLVNLYNLVNKNIEDKTIVSANVIEEGGSIIALIKSALGNRIGFDLIADKEMFNPLFGSFIVQTKHVIDFKEFEVNLLGRLNFTNSIKMEDKLIRLSELTKSFEETLESVFPTTASAEGECGVLSFFARKTERAGLQIATPRVVIPVFPGTNCEYDTVRAFERAGAIAKTVLIKNQNSADIEESIERLVKELRNSQIVAFPGGFSGGDEPDGSGKFIATTFRNPKIAEEVMKLLYERDGLAIGICNGFQALIKLGLVPYGDIREQIANAPTLTFNNISRHISTIARIRVATNKSPWLSSVKVGEVFNVPISHGEGKFVSSTDELNKLIKTGQVATQYVDLADNCTMKSPHNPNGSMYGIEGIISPDGRVLGKMGHAERWDDNLYKNVEGNYDMKIFESGVKYFS